MSLTAADIAEIARLLDESKFASLDLQMGEFKLRIRRDGGGWSAPARDDADDGIVDIAHPVDAPEAGAAPVASGGPAAGEVDVHAPLLGNFYSAPRPGDPPFVSVGDTVGADTTIGIIEVMKLMNPIRAGVSGTVVALLAANGTSVEEGQALIRVKAA